VSPIDTLQKSSQALAALLPPLLLAEASRVAATVAQGLHGRRRQGPGDAFWQFRRYQLGDSLRDIDWRRSARFGPLFVREREWEAAQTVWLWCDGSPSMEYRSDRALPSKKERAQVLTVALAILLLEGGERVGLLGAGHSAMSGKNVTAALAETLAAGPALPEPGRVAPPSRHAQAVLIGDFLDPPEVFASRLHRLNSFDLSGHILQVLDPAEESLPFRGRVRFEGMEGEGETLIERSEDVREAYLARLADHRQRLRETARHMGWTFDVHHTATSPASALLNLHAALSGPSRRVG